MPIIFKCPNGHELVTEDRYAGRQVRCPHCQLVLTIPSPPVTAIVAAPLAPEAAPIPDEIDDRHVIEDDEDQEIFIEEEDDRPRRRGRDRDDDEEEERPRKRKKKGLTRQQFALTNLGLAFHYANFLCLLVGTVLVLIGFLGLLLAGVGFHAAGRDRAAAGAMVGLANGGLVLGHIGSFAILPVGPLLGITGSILCCWVPARTGAKPLIATSLGLNAGALVLTLVTFLVAGTISFQTVEAESAAAVVLSLLALGCSLAGFVLFLLFLRRLAYFLGDTSSGDEAMSLLIYFICLAVGGVLGLILLVALAVAAGRIAGTALLIAGIVAYTMFTIKFLQLILALIGTIRQNLRTRYNV
jgi:hypothetical protein